MTNQDPNEIEEAAAVVPQRTYAQWLQQCESIDQITSQNVVEAASLKPSEVYWENGVLMVLDYVVYDSNTNPSHNAETCQMIAFNFLSSISDDESFVTQQL